MYYAVKGIEDAEKICKKHPKINKKKLRYLINVCVVYYKQEAAIFVDEDNGELQYCYLEYYNKIKPEYGKQGYLSKDLKYNKELLKETICVK